MNWLALSAVANLVTAVAVLAVAAVAVAVGLELRSVHATSTPVDAINSTSVSTSRMRGTFSSTTGCSVRSAAHTIGSAAFLFPDGRMVPDSRWPPSTTYCSALVCNVRIVQVREWCEE